MTDPFCESCFQENEVKFKVHASPVSAQGKTDVKQRLRQEINEITSKSEFIITSTCWVAIDYYCQHVKRQKNPGMYDLDNIIKPIVDSLVGLKGLVIDDSIIDRFTVNWIDTPSEDFFEIFIEYPELLYSNKANLVFVKSKSGWCFPTSESLSQHEIGIEMIKRYFGIWDSISNENEYNETLGTLPIQKFIYHNKISTQEYKIIDL